MSDTIHSRRVLEICDELLPLAGDHRSRRLEAVCAGDPLLRASVDSVLLAVEASGQFLDTDAAASAAADYLGRTIGPYRILEHIGEGGMGSVYLAERRQAEFSQRVAIKFVHGHLMARDVVGRFNDERKILATLNHPYIASLIDAGSTAEGVPYLVLEHVVGMPIDEYCDAHSLGIPDRIRLVRKVAAAVQAAHQHLVVHRDLKPSNVLITPDGIPKLLDFGIAKLLQADETACTGNATVLGRQAMTPDYASPEQILENRVTTASDVYTLGILVYQLLVGERPYHVPSTSHADMVRAFDALAVPRPSTRLDTLPSEDARLQVALRRGTTTQQLRRLLRGDLDTILLKALRAEPDRRYASVAQFSDDLGRYLAGQPVTARDDTFSYRAIKFVQRNRLASAVAAAFALSLVVGIIAYSSQAREAERQRDAAQAQARQARNTVDFLKQVLFAGNPFSTNEDRQSISDILSAAEQGVRSAYADDPPSRALILTALGEIFISRGEYQRGGVLAAEAVELYANASGFHGNEAANAHRVKALAAYYLDDYAQATQQLEVAIALFTEQQSPDWSGLVKAYDQLGMAQSNRHGGDAALVAYHKALDIYRARGLDDPGQLVTILNNIATENLQRGNYALAEELLREAISLSDTSEIGSGQAGMLLGNHAGALKNLGRINEAEASYERSVDLLVSSLGEAHPETIAMITSLANLQQQMGNLTDAAVTIRRALKSSTESLSEDQFLASYAQNVGASILCRLNEVAEGTRLARLSLRTRSDLLPAGHWAISSGEGVLGACLTASGDYRAAEDLLVPAYQHLREARGDDNEATVSTRQRLNELYVAWGKPVQAEQFSSAVGAAGADRP